MKKEEKPANLDSIQYLIGYVMSAAPIVQQSLSRGACLFVWIDLCLICALERVIYSSLLMMAIVGSWFLVGRWIPPRVHGNMEKIYKFT
jgi:hypothetical protein